jgi:hypothetical protein
MNDLEELTTILEQHPRLHDGGYGGTVTPENRAALLAKVAAFAVTKQWIGDNLTPTKSINHRRTSYGMKHIAERTVGYITNGVFIAAMLACGYRMQPAPGFNPSFNVSEGSVRAAWRRAWKRDPSGFVA